MLSYKLLKIQAYKILLTVRMKNKKILTIPCASQDVKYLEFSYIAGIVIKCEITLENTLQFHSWVLV